MNQIYWTFCDSNTQKPEGIHGTGKMHHKFFVDKTSSSYVVKVYGNLIAVTSEIWNMFTW